MSKSILKQEFIGAEAEIVDAKNKRLAGLKGKIIDETKNTLKIKTNKGNKIVVKNQITLQIKIGGKKYEFKGALIAHRAEERIKK